MSRDFSGGPGAAPIMGGAFRDTAWVLRQDWRRIAALSLLLLTPLEATSAWLQVHAPGKPYSPLAIGFAVIVPGLIQTVFVSLYIGGLAWSIDRLLQGKRTSLPELARHALRRWPTMTGVELVASAASLGGLILLVIPGLVITSRWLVAPQVAAIEDGGLRNALARSAYLTKGRRWLAVGVFVVSTIAYYSGYYAIELSLQAIVGAPLREPVPTALNRYLLFPLYTVLYMSLSVVFHTAFFHRLLAARGSRADITAEVFD